MNAWRVDPLENALAPERRTDLLSEALDALRVDSSTLGLFDMREPWGLALDHLPFSTSWTIMEGRVWMVAPDGERTEFGPGDTLLLPRGIRSKTYVFASSPDVAPVSATEFWQQAELEGYEPGDSSKRTQHLSWGGDGSVTRIVTTAFSFKDSQLGPLITALPEVMVVRASVVGGKGRFIDSLLRLAIDGEDAALPGFSSLATQIAQLLLVLVVRSYALSIDKGAVGLLAGLGDPQIGRALSCIHRQPGVAWTVAGLARAAGLSRSLFAQRFVAILGQTPIEYLRSWRIHLACEALADRKVIISAIAHDLGYRSEAAFRSAFRRAVGQPPKEFRRQVRTKRVQKLAEDFAPLQHIRGTA